MRSGPRRASAPRLSSGYRPGYYTRTLVTRVGKLKLHVPQDRDGRFSMSHPSKESAGALEARQRLLSSAPSSAVVDGLLTGLVHLLWGHQDHDPSGRGAALVDL